MPKRITASPEPPSEEVLQHLADLGAVPAAQRELFFKSVHANVQTARYRDGIVKKGLTKKNGTTLLHSAFALYEVLGKLSKKERKLLEKIWAESRNFYRTSSGGERGLRDTAYELVELFSLATGAPPPRYPHQTPQPRQRGRRRDAVKDWNFQNFVLDLLISTTTADGKLTLEKNGPFGTLIDAIEMLAPSLPDGFLPKPLPASTLQRLKLRLKKIVADLKRLDGD